MVKGVSINIFNKTTLKILIIFSILVAFFLVILSFFVIFSKKGENTGYTKSDIFSSDSYYCKYKMQVFSNKNQSIYTVKEWYKKSDTGYNFKFEFLDLPTSFSYYGNEKSVTISSDTQLNQITFSDMLIEKQNVISISTFIDTFYNIDKSIINRNYESNNCCKINESHDDGIISYLIEFKNNTDTKCDICNKFRNFNMDISKIELLLNEKDFSPSQYIVYTSSGNAMYDIIYEEFELNVDF